jgi:predicted MFS family arabinose efflux permease
MEGYRPRQEWIGTPKHMKAMSAHRALAFVYGAIAAIVVIFFTVSSSRAPSSGMLLALVFCIPATLHALIAIGAARANAVAQVFSVLAAVFMLFAVPIGTVIGIYLLRNAGWQKPASEAKAINNVPPAA